MIAEQEWHNYTYEDTLRWSQDRVDMYSQTMNATNEWREEQREKAEEEAKYGERPDWVSEEDWERLEGPMKKRVAEGKMGKDSLRHYLNSLDRDQ